MRHGRSPHLRSISAIMYINRVFHDKNFKEDIPFRQESIPPLPRFSFLPSIVELFQCSIVPMFFYFLLPCFLFHVLTSQGKNTDFYPDRASDKENL